MDKLPAIFLDIDPDVLRGQQSLKLKAKSGKLDETKFLDF
jgi:hypothetical protein